MTRLKVRLLAAIAAAALMAFVGTASATTITSPAGTTYTSYLSSHAFNTVIHGSFTSVKCGHSYLEGLVWSHGGIGSARVDVTDFVFKECNYLVYVRLDGSLSIDSSNAVQSNGAEIEIQTSVGTCIFTTSFTNIGTLTEGNWATLDIASAKIPRTGGSFFCGSSGTWTGSYTFHTPNPIWVD